MNELLHIREADGAERFVPYGELHDYAQAAKADGVDFTVLRSAATESGKRFDVPENEWEAFEEANAKEKDRAERVRPFQDDSMTHFVTSDGGRYDVPNDEREAFLEENARMGASVVSESPGVKWLSEKEADEALEGGIDWGEVGKSATQGWKFPTRLAMSVAEGAVAIPTLAVMAGEYGLAKAGALEEGAHPLGKHGMQAMRAIEAAKPEYNLDTGSESWRNPAGIVHNVMAGSLGALEFIGEIAATAGVGGAVKKGAQKVGMKALKSGAMATAREASKEAAEAAGKRAVATKAERRAARKAAESLGVAWVDMADRAAVTAFAEAYARQLPRELLKEGARTFAKQALKPNYWKLNMASRNALETYEAFESTGSDEDRAMLKALGDGTMGYLTLSLGDGAGAFAGGLRATGATQLLRALTQGTAKPWLKAELAGAAVKALAGAAAQGGSAYGHLSALQKALGEEAVSDDAIWGAAVTSGLFGAAMGAVSSIRPIRQALMYDKELTLGRRTMADGGPAWRPQPGQQGWARLEFPEGGARPGGMPGAQSPAPFRPVAVHADGDILFGDGSVWRARTNDWRLPNGAVVDGNGDVVTVSPSGGMEGQRNGGVAGGAPLGARDAGGANPPTFQPSTPPNADETLGLFELIRSGETKVFNVPLSEIQPNTQIIQFKADANPVTGVVRGQELQGEFQALPSKPVLLWQAADGHIEPATGRHRIDLARRNGLETIPANIIREADGWTPERTRLLDAMDNILDEKGSDQDFVSFFRGSGLDRDAAARKGLLARKKGRDAFEIAREGSEDLYSLVMGKDPWVTPEKAAAIAREAPCSQGAFAEGAQRAVAKAVRERNLTADGAAIMARGLMAARRQRREASGFAQDDLFGADDTALALAAEEAAFADGERRKALRALQRLTAAMSKGDALALKGEFAESLGIKDPADKRQLEAAAECLRGTAARWENYHTAPELYRKAHAYATEALGIPDVVVERADGSLVTDRELGRARDLTAKTQPLGAAPYAGRTPAQGSEVGRMAEEGTLFSPAPWDDGEAEAVRRAFTAPGGGRKAGWLRAPNGKPTKLSERQWLQVRTPSFKRWFGDWENDPANASKALDENGEPLVVYHRTDAGFRAFDMGRARQSMDLPAAYFSSGTEDWGEMGERVVAAFINLRNPREGKPLAKGDGRSVRDALLREGFDGTIEREEGMETEYGVFDPKAIKSATDNSGAFDPGTDDILASPAPEEGVLMSPAPGAGRAGKGAQAEANPLAQAEERRAEVEALDAAANGPGFVPLERGDNLNRLEDLMKEKVKADLRNDRFDLDSAIATNGNAKKLSVVKRDGLENTGAHTFAAKNLATLYAKASVAVRHVDKKLVDTKGRKGDYVRLFTPFRFNGQTYVAMISQRESEVPGVHAIEALDVVPAENIKAEDGLVYSSGRERRTGAAGSATPIRSALTEEKVAYTLGDVNKTHPRHLDGTPYPADALLEDVQDAVARFELRAAGLIAKAQPRTAPAQDGEMGETLGNAGAASPRIREPRMFAGERILPAGAYPMEGRLELLGGAPGSPASEFGRRTLGLSDLTLIYRELTGGDLPKVISNRARMGKAYGKYFVGKNRIELAAQIFGLLDESDVDELRHRLTKQGYFRHLDPAWAAAMKPATRKLEKRRSEERLEREVKRFAKERVKQGLSGEREVKVLAHELWHMIDDQDGGLRGRGNLVGRLAALKHYMKEAFPVEGFAGNAELKREAEGFIRWWRGVPNPEDTAYFMNAPEETLAEIGGAYFTAPMALRERAPKLYDAWTFALAQHPKAQEAYDNAVAYIAGGERAKRLALTQSRTWTREAQRTMRALTQQATGMDNSLKRWGMRLNAYLWDRRGPAIMLYNEASRDSLKALRAELRAGRIEKADYEAAKARFDHELAWLKKRHLDYTRLGTGLSRLYLADVRGELGARLAEVDPNPDIARALVDEYAFNKRVLELRGRAVAYGTTAADARAILNDMTRRLGLEGMRKVIAAWRTFRAIYEREVIESASVQRMLGPKAIELMRANASYVTMRHTLTPEQAERLAERLMDKKKANGATLEIALERLLPRGGESGGSRAMSQLRRLKGSLQATESPLLATMKTAVGLITAAERNAAVADLAKALADSGHVEARIVPWGEAVANARHAPIEFWEGGEHKALMVPAIVAKGFRESDNQALKVMTYATRLINATHTTNNPGFVPRAQIKDVGASSLNIPGLWRTPLHYAKPVIGDLAALGFQFIPPHVMRKIGGNPLGRLLLNPHTVEYWTSFGNKMARMIHSADFVGALEEARRARAAGNEAKAKELEFLVQMSRAALRDGVLLNMVQFRGMEYNDSDWKALFARYNLDFDELPPEESRKLSPRRIPGAAWGLAKKGWNKVGDASEIAAMTTKLGVYCYLHRDATPGMGDVTEAGSFADPLKRAVAAYRAATLAGDPTFELKGHWMTFYELSRGPFLNARQKGFLRAFEVDGKQPWLTDAGDYRMLSGPRQAAEKTLKLTAHWASRFYYGALLAGGLSAATLGLYRLLTGNDEATEEDMDGTALGTLDTFFRWSEKTLRNCSPYTLLNFWTDPVWSEGDVSVVLCTPISDEERVLNLLMDATLNQAGLPTINPATGFSEVTAEAFNNLMNPVGGEGSLGEFRRILAPWLENQNPFDPFRKRPALSDKEHAARWTEPNAAKTMAWRAIGASPLSLVLKPGDVRGDEIPEGPLKTFHAFITRTPIISSVVGSFLRFQIGGETLRKRMVERLDEQERMRWMLRAENDYKAFAQTGGFTPPEDIPQNFAPDYKKRFIELISEAAAKKNPDAKRRERLEETARSALRLRNPKWRAWHLRSLRRELGLGE